MLKGRNVGAVRWGKFRGCDKQCFLTAIPLRLPLSKGFGVLNSTNYLPIKTDFWVFRMAGDRGRQLPELFSERLLYSDMAASQQLLT